LFTAQVAKGTTKALAFEVGSPASPVVLGGSRIESKVQYFTILWVSHNCDVAHGVPVYSNDSFDIYEVVSRCVVADRSQPHTFTLEELNAAYEAMHWLRKYDWQNFLLEQCRNP
jgi:hypothetical protein